MLLREMLHEYLLRSTGYHQVFTTGWYLETEFLQY